MSFHILQLKHDTGSLEGTWSRYWYYIHQDTINNGYALHLSHHSVGLMRVFAEYHYTSERVQIDLGGLRSGSMNQCDFKLTRYYWRKQPYLSYQAFQCRSQLKPLMGRWASMISANVGWNHLMWLSDRVPWSGILYIRQCWELLRFYVSHYTIR